MSDRDPVTIRRRGEEGTETPGLRSAYAAAGVDVDAAERVVDVLKSRLGRPPPDTPDQPGAGRQGRGHEPVELLSGIGTFASAVALPGGYREPALVSATDGVGTKTAIATALGRYDTIGQDLVAMCADDVVCAGARPLFFLDYIAVGRLDPHRVAGIVAGVATACEAAGCALVGGETAEHPGLMEDDEFDLAGFCVGIVERDALLDGSAARAGDVLLGLASSGLHANGYSLVRALVERHALPLHAPYADVVRDRLGEAERERVVAEEPEVWGVTLGDVLLTPTRIYCPDLLSLRDALAAVRHQLRGLAHVTGGGLPGNVPRALPDSLAARVDPHSWPVPSVFRLLAALGKLSGAELRATFNAGLGMVAVVSAGAVDAAVAHLAARGVAAWPIGDVAPAEAVGGARYVEERVRDRARSEGPEHT
ncbi:MAG: phosphoribosylformylglycinamidine cyclo-ligase [Chloroflexota bacterium]|nr:phosphoribosylformylglycinamidine cyclo-ligase [Chloroflexota bacterium]